MLAAKLLDLERQRRDEQIAEISGKQSNVDFGSQIRSYVLQPYEMVRDLRTDFEIGDVARVLDGGLDDFIEEDAPQRLAELNLLRDAISG